MPASLLTSIRSDRSRARLAQHVRSLFSRILVMAISRREPLSVVIFVSDDVVDTAGRVVRRPKDVADAILERRLHGQRPDE